MQLIGDERHALTFTGGLESGWGLWELRGHNSWVIFKWPKSWINPFGLAWLNLCLRYTKTKVGEEKVRERITSEKQKGLVPGVQTRCTTSTNGSKAYQLSDSPTNSAENPSCLLSHSNHSKFEHLQPLTHSGPRTFWHSAGASLHGSVCVCMCVCQRPTSICEWFKGYTFGDDVW